MFKDRTLTLATLASLLVGVSLFGATVYLSQYFQMARGMSPTAAGLMSIPNVLGLMVATTVSGKLITKTGSWKKWLVGGMAVLVGSLCLLGTIDEATPLAIVGTFQFIMGLGLGCVMQNLVLAVQDNCKPEYLGTTSSLVTFFRSMGGSLGVAAMGTVLSHHVTNEMSTLGIGAGSGSGSLDLSALPDAALKVYEHAFGTGVAEAFLLAAPFAFLSLLLVLFIEEVPLRNSHQVEESV